MQILFYISDYRLNPQLKKSCQMDIPKFCSEIIHNSKQDEDLEGKVINCLKKQFVRRVSFSLFCCQKHIYLTNVLC